ncbi:unnamed protein product [Penicillium salamii]|uniref:Uncharacterized protein n=1 Tax=Penicillium salamii TaxID=1612424 RepID=A0A9W4NAY3_9EURO|nr:unnamed protein product [Penicillium salamii]CAG8045166.1 unnamed protein product [Penicillium salamii]CAG8338002.1 unnamed protein product [Penicillium salamii]CAG8346676.1 unnamed protein product [Penicillium salamii]CAG8346758.1 unnamed protein product [Penicillium salamii]
MFYQNGTMMREFDTSAQGVKWVNVFLDKRDGRLDDLAIMCTIVTCIRTRVVSITDHAMHLDMPLCVSIRVPGDHHNRESILAAAELSAESLRSHVAAGSVWIDRALLFQR